MYFYIISLFYFPFEFKFALVRCLVYSAAGRMAGDILFCKCVCVRVCVCVSTPGQRVSTDSKQGHTASMTYRVQRSCGHGWEGKADHLPVPARFPTAAVQQPSADVHKLLVETPSIDRTHHLAVESFLSLGN